MARKIESRLRINFTLKTRTPLHIGGMGASVDTDLALAVNGKGDYYIPGTSLAGALRGWLETRANETTLKAIRGLWGHQKQKDERRKDEQQQLSDSQNAQKGKDEQASFVLIEDACITPPPGKQIVFAEIRDSVGIDRVTGAAANQIKFDRAILPRGTQFNFDMWVELVADQPDLKNPGKKIGKSDERNTARLLTQTVLDALRQNQIRFGASKSRGLGRVEVVNEVVVEQCLLTKEGMLAALRGQGSAPQSVKESPLTLAKSQCLEIEITWKPRGPLMVKAEHDGIAVDMLPLVSAIDDHLTFVLPGSSIKGAFRSQAERIVRTLLPIEALTPVEKKRDFIKQLAVKEPGQSDTPEHASLIGWLFGIAGQPDEDSKTKKDEKKEDNKRPKPPLAGYSAVLIDDCYAKLNFDATQWAAIEQANDEPTLRQKLNDAQLGKAQQAFHVAIDRWLGSAADGFLYSVLEPHEVEWERICLTLDLARLPDRESQKRAMMLLLLTLRDFVAGRIPLGFGSNRGMGAVEVTQLKITPQDCDGLDWLNGLKDILLIAGKLSVPPALRETLDVAWKNWLPTAKGEATQ